MAKGRPNGGNRLASTKINTKKSTKVNAEVQRKKIYTEAELDENRIFYCTCCGKGYKTRQNNFMKSNSILYEANDGYIQVCKTCTAKYYKTLVEFFCGNEEKALERCCQLFDFYYNEQAVAATSSSPNIPRIHQYPARMNMVHVKSIGTDYLQTIADRAEESKKITEVETVAAQPTETTSGFVVTPEIIKKWSKGMTPDEYEFLENQYDDWYKKVEITTKTQEELIITICLAQLNVRRSQATGNKVAEAMKTFTDLLSTMNLTPRQAKEGGFSSQTQMSLGELIKKIETEEPIGEPIDEFKDPDRIREYVDVWFNGHAAKALHIKNDNQEKYERELAKYTVDVPEHDAFVENINELLDQ